MASLKGRVIASALFKTILTKQYDTCHSKRSSLHQTSIHVVPSQTSLRTPHCGNRIWTNLIRNALQQNNAYSQQQSIMPLQNIGPRRFCIVWWNSNLFWLHVICDPQNMQTSFFFLTSILVHLRNLVHCGNSTAPKKGQLKCGAASISGSQCSPNISSFRVSPSAAVHSVWGRRMPIHLNSKW